MYSFLFILILLCILCIPLQEGLQLSSDLDYLAPLNTPTVLDADTLLKFTNAYNTTNELVKSLSPLTSTYSSFFTANATVDEFNYYIKNNKWSYNTYITTFISKNPDLLDKTTTFSPNAATLDTMQKAFPNRIAYRMLVLPIESRQDPSPMSYQIFMGTTPPDSTLTKLKKSI